MDINKVRRLLTESVFYCDPCGRYVDSDVDGCEEVDGELVCLGCHEQIGSVDNLGQDLGEAPLDPDLDYVPVNVPHRMGESMIDESVHGDMEWEDEPNYDMDDSDLAGVQDLPASNEAYEYEGYAIDYDGDWNWTKPDGEYGGSCESSAECEAAVDEDIRDTERAQSTHDHKMTFDKIYQNWWRQQERQREVDRYGVRGE